MSRSETEYLRHILDEANYLAKTNEKVRWEVATRKAPQLIEQISAILQDEGAA